MELKEKIRPIIEDLNYYLYDIEIVKEDGNDILRVMIENETYINIDDCVVVSKVLSEKLDEIDPFEDPYMLEVTSAGAERELRTSDEIKRAVGKGVFIETLEHKFEGKLEKFKDDVLTIKTKNKKTHQINNMDVEFIRLAIML